MSEYSFFDKIRLFFDLIYTKLFFRNCRLIRRPFYVRGKRGFYFGKGLTTGHGCRFDASSSNQSLIIGENARFGDYVHINADKRVSIGDNVLVASKVFISDTSHGLYKGDIQDDPFTNPSNRKVVSKEVVIGNNVWIGENVVILAGTTIGDGCIIGANSVLTSKSYPDNSIIVGCPGRVIKIYSEKTKKWEKI